MDWMYGFCVAQFLHNKSVEWLRHPLNLMHSSASELASKWAKKGADYSNKGTISSSEPFIMEFIHQRETGIDSKFSYSP